MNMSFLHYIIIIKAARRKSAGLYVLPLSFFLILTLGLWSSRRLSVNSRLYQRFGRRPNWEDLMSSAYDQTSGILLTVRLSAVWEIWERVSEKYKVERKLLATVVERP